MTFFAPRQPDQVAWDMARFLQELQAKKKQTKCLIPFKGDRERARTKMSHFKWFY